MKITNKEGKDIIYPSMTIDANGKVIYVNRASIQNNKFTINEGDSLSSLFNEDYIRKLTMFDTHLDLVDVRIEKYREACVRVRNKELSKQIDIFLLSTKEREKEELLFDRKMLSSYKETVNSTQVKIIDVYEFRCWLLDMLSKDVRLAYRKINGKGENESSFCVNMHRLQAIIIAIISMITEIDYRSIIEIELKKTDNKLSLGISTKTVKPIVAIREDEIMEDYPEASLRLMYVSNLCQSKGIEYDIQITENSIISSFSFPEEKRKGKLAREPIGVDDSDLLAKYLNIFF